MRAAYLEAPGRLVVRDAEMPIPAAGEALVRVGACGVCGSDVHIFKDGRIGDALMREPHILGHEFGGVVEAVGSPEDERLVGRRVAVEPAIPCMRCETCLAGDQNCCPQVRFCGLPPTPGAYREYIVHPEWLCEPVPDSLTPNQIAALEPLAIAVHAMDLAKPGLGRGVVILGAGMIGQMFLETAKLLRPMPLIVADRLDYRLDMALKAGASHAVNVDKEDLARCVMDITRGHGADYVFEATTSDDAAASAVECAAPAGKVLLCGIADTDRVTLSNSIARRRGLTIYMVRRSRRTLARAIHLIESGAVDVDRTITHEFPLERIATAFDLMSGYSDGIVKAMIHVGRP